MGKLDGSCARERVTDADERRARERFERAAETKTRDAGADRGERARWRDAPTTGEGARTTRGAGPRARQGVRQSHSRG